MLEQGPDVLLRWIQVVDDAPAIVVQLVEILDFLGQSFPKLARDTVHLLVVINEHLYDTGASFFDIVQVVNFLKGCWLL